MGPIESVVHMNMKNETKRGVAFEIDIELSCMFGVSLTRAMKMARMFSMSWPRSSAFRGELGRPGRLGGRSNVSMKTASKGGEIRRLMGG